MSNFFTKYKPGAPKIVLIIMGASLWAFAAYRILKLGIIMIEMHALNHYMNYLIGLAGFFPFFLLVFRKVSKRYVNRIIHHKYERPCIFGFFDLRGYILMSFMITMGIMVSRWEVIPAIYKGTFFISLGLSLLASAVFYIVEGVKFIKGRNELSDERMTRATSSTIRGENERE
ncbi:MAG: hypothetical protein HXX13_17850 [Bacteroidetes bacterium]|nr:hypothetical protein [Bacteroidota bacterium]